MANIHTALKNLHLRPVAYYPIYAIIMGSVAGGVVLSQLLYWRARTNGPFYKTDEELARETGCSIKEVRAAKQRLRELPFMRVEVCGLPARTHYDVDWDALIEVLASIVVDEHPCSEEEDGDTENGQTSLPDSVKLECPNWANLNAPNGQTITKTTTKTTTENIVHSSSGADARTSETDTNRTAKEKPRTLRLRIETPPKERKKTNYYAEVAAAFREVMGDDSDALAIRACLSAWKQVREGGSGVRGLSAEEITSLWKRARERASPEYRDRISLLWVLNNGEKARRMVEYEPPAERQPMRVVDHTEEVLRILAERKAMGDLEVQDVGRDRTT